MALRNIIRRGVTSVPTSAWDVAGRFIPARRRPAQFGEKMHKAANALNLGAPEQIYRRLVSQWHDPNSIVIGAAEPKGLLWDATLRRDIPDFFARMQFVDTLTYLHDAILTKVDRASMAVSLASRVPLLDHRGVEFARRLTRPEACRVGKECGSRVRSWG